MPVATNHSHTFGQDPESAPKPAPEQPDSAHAFLTKFVQSRRAERKADADQSTYLFGECELRSEQREILLRGQIQQVQPRVFDLLYYLLKNQHRVVTRDELLTHVWKNAYVSDSVIGRCIMKARRVIGDTNPDAPLIKTLPRAGYRFVGVASSSESPELREHAGGSRNGDANRIATLPFVNSTGESRLVWIEFGLAALFNSLIEKEDGFVATSILDVVAAMESVEGDRSQQHMVRALQEILKARVVVTAQVSRLESGFELTYQVFGPGLPGRPSVAHGADLTQLTTDMAEEVLRQLRAMSAPSPPMALPLDTDPFVSEAFSRASLAQADQRYQRALDYLEICVLEPDTPLQVRLEYACALARVEHPDTERTAVRLLRGAIDQDDCAAHARLRACIAESEIVKGCHGTASAMIDEAIELAEAEADDELSAELLLVRARLAILQRDFNMAISLGGRALAYSKSSGENRIASRCMLNEGDIWALRGMPARAGTLFKLAAELSEKPRVLHSTLAQARLRLARLEFESGPQDAARTYVGGAVALARDAGVPSEAALAAFCALQINRFDVSRPDTAEALHVLTAPQMQQSAIGRFLGQLANGCVNWRAGNVEVALNYVVVARSSGQPHRELWLGFAAGLCCSLAIAAGNFGLARDLIADMEREHGFYEGTSLQGVPEFHRAALAHAYGNRAEAWQMLHQILEVASPGELRTRTCLAVAWLACENHNLDEARDHLAKCPEWVQHQPLGMAAQARYLFETRRFDEAAGLQAKAIDSLPCTDAEQLHKRLLATYRHAATTHGYGAAVRLPHLLTLLAF